ncbi:hypothetical protein GCM10009665_16440 [Kitasatospora nipponensis]|uniref:Uncharacterized protein n=1 Tax=Kitasatospora nipponensis TaxID=258049 RepID=A0ABN1W0R4_9ACTN
MLEAAVATGSCAMPVKLPEPSLGTAAQAEPNGIAAASAAAGVPAAGEPADGAADEDDEAAAAGGALLALVPPLLPQAVRPRASAPAARTAAREVPRVLLIMMVFLRVIGAHRLRAHGGGTWAQRVRAGAGSRAGAGRVAGAGTDRRGRLR